MPVQRAASHAVGGDERVLFYMLNFIAIIRPDTFIRSLYKISEVKLPVQIWHTIELLAVSARVAYEAGGENG